MDATILIYFKKIESSGKRLQLQLANHFLPEMVETCHEFQTLSKRLRESGNDQTILVLIISNIEELIRMTKIGKHLHEFKVILILPNCLEETHTLAYRLFPEFISYIDSDFADVLPVMQNLLKRSEQFKTSGERIHYIV